MGLLTEYQRRTSVQRMVELCGVDNPGGLKQTALSGTVTLVAGSAAVVGSGTTFTAFVVDTVLEFSSQPGVGYVVQAIADATHLTLAYNYSGLASASASVVVPGIDLNKLQAAVEDAQQRFTEATAIPFDDTTAAGPPPSGNRFFFVGRALVTAFLYDYRGRSMPGDDAAVAWAVAQKELDRWMVNYGAGAWAAPTSDSNLTPSVSPMAPPQFDPIRLTQVTPFPPGGPGQGGGVPNQWNGGGG